MPPVRKSLATPALAALLAALALGCGSDDTGGGASTGGGGATQPPPAESEPKAEPVARLELTESDFELDPAQAKVDRTGTVAVEVRNAGETVHALAIEGPAGEFGTPEIDPGGSATVEADLGQAGAYTWYCPVSDHRSRGMEGTLTVGDAAAGGGGRGGGAEEEQGGGSSGY